MTTARTVAPNLGGRVNTRSRAAVAISLTARAPTTRRSPRRHLGAWVVALCCDVAWPPGLGKRAETFPKKGSIPSHGASFNGLNAEVDRIGERDAVGDGSHASDALICAATGTTRRIKPGIDAGQSTFNADRQPSHGGLKNEIGPACRTVSAPSPSRRLASVGSTCPCRCQPERRPGPRCAG